MAPLAIREATPEDEKTLRALAERASAPPLAEADWAFLLAEGRERGGSLLLGERDGRPVAAIAGTMRDAVCRIGLHVALPGEADATARLVAAASTAANASGGKAPLAALVPAVDTGFQEALVARGLLPRLPVLRLEGRATPFAAPFPEGVTAAPLALDEPLQRTFALWDGAVLAPRPRDHAHLATRPDVRGILYRKGERAMGYAYVHASGRVGPFACADMNFVAPLLRHAASEALALSGGRIEALVPGSAGAAFEVFLGELELRVAESFTLLTERYAPAWDVALPWNAAFL